MLRCGFGRTCFFTVITCSTSTLPSSGNTRNTRPSFPVSRPVITFTVSFRRISTRLCSVDTDLLHLGHLFPAEAFLRQPFEQPGARIGIAPQGAQLVFVFEELRQFAEQHLQELLRRHRSAID